MNTQECLDNLDKTLTEEGVPEVERLERVATLKHCIEYGEEMSAKLKATKTPARKWRKVEMPKVIELSVWAFVAGWFAGIATLHYAQKP